MGTRDNHTLQEQGWASAHRNSSCYLDEVLWLELIQIVSPSYMHSRLGTGQVNKTGETTTVQTQITTH